jgi:DNA-binding response OmpR family regulator
MAKVIARCVGPWIAISTGMTEYPVLLVIQDSTSSPDIDAHMLDQSGLTVRAARAEVGYEVARAERPDVIAIDLATPRGNAWTICRLLKADPRTASIPVIVLAGCDASETAAHARFAGAHAVVTRPFSLDSLGLAFQAALAH